MKTIKMTESELIRVVKKVLSEQNIKPKHPVQDPLYVQFKSDVEGDNVIGKK
jgi:hypothetical protein